MSSRENLSILVALDNLATLVEIESLDEIEITENSEIIAHPAVEQGEEKEESYWIGAGADEQTIAAVKQTFKVVYHYLKNSYEKGRTHADSKRMIEGINTIMVLVGEAAKKLERFSELFQHKITNLKEYRDLQNFYRNKVIKESFQEFAKKPVPKEDEKEADFISELLGETLEHEEVIEPSTIYLLDDIETVKKDTHYELFYLKSEEGRNFYTHELARNIKLACDFGKYSEEYFGDDPLLQIKNWQDKGLQILAKRILDQNKHLIEGFFKEAISLKSMELVSSLSHALMALMLAANPRNLIRQFALKGCHRYFADFQLFLREVLVSRDYQKFLLYSVPASKPFFTLLLDLIQSLALSLYTLKEGEEELQKAFREMIIRQDPAVFEQKLFGDFLDQANALYDNVLKDHPNGPLFKAVDLIREEPQIFDPILEDNIPGLQAKLQWKDQEVALLRLPAPMTQEFIHRAWIVDEFKGFLRAYIHKGEGYKHLIFNFQDRTSWKEHARSAALEELQRNAEFAKTLFVATLAKDTEFYWQIGEYSEITSAAIFIEQLNQQIHDEATGFYFTPPIRKILFPHFLKQLIETIHADFFQGKQTLSYQDRLQFIEATYLGIELKLIDELKPNSISFLSKDSLDVGCCEAISFIDFLKCFQKQKWNIEEKEKALQILYGPTLVARERNIHKERFERMHGFLEFIEERAEHIQSLSPLFPNGILNAKLDF